MGRKIGFAINSIQGGAGEPWKTGLDEKKWIKGVVDPRELLRFWDIPQDKCIKFMTFGQDGTYYVWAKYSSSRGGSDSLSKWIYIPNGVKISGKEILEYESKAKDEEQTDVLEKLFATEFPYEPAGNAIPVTNVNGKEKYAVRYYDTEDQLADIIGEKRFQQYYSGYKVIFLIDRQSGIMVREGAVIDDLTDRPMEERIIVYRPYSCDIENKFGLNVTLYRGDECIEEDTEIPAYKGELIDVTAKRYGFKDIICKIKAREDKQCCKFVSDDKCIWSKIITKEFFHVDDAENNIDGDVNIIPLEELNIYINGKLIKEEGVTLTEKECEDCTIEVEEPKDKSSKRTSRYEPFKKENANILLDEVENFPIHLERKLSCFKYKIQLSNKEEATLVIHSKNGGLNEKAPFVAYVVEPNPSPMRSKEMMLVLNPFYLLKLIMIGFGIGVVVASIVFFTLFYHGKEDNQSPNPSPGVVDSDSVQDNEFYNEVDLKAYSLDAAIRYLENNKIWNRDSMERYDNLKGLFDAMNEFRLSTVIDSYSQLSKSTKYATLVETAKKNVSNGWNPKTGEHNPQYNNANDIIINFTNYINWIDRDREIPKFTDTVKPDKVKTDKVKPDKEKPDKVKTDKVKPDKKKNDKVKTDKVKPNAKKILVQG